MSMKTISLNVSLIKMSRNILKFESLLFLPFFSAAKLNEEWREGWKVAKWRRRGLLADGLVCYSRLEYFHSLITRSISSQHFSFIWIYIVVCCTMMLFARNVRSYGACPCSSHSPPMRIADEVGSVPIFEWTHELTFHFHFIFPSLKYLHWSEGWNRWRVESSLSSCFTLWESDTKVFSFSTQWYVRKICERQMLPTHIKYFTQVSISTFYILASLFSYSNLRTSLCMSKSVWEEETSSRFSKSSRECEQIFLPFHLPFSIQF